MSNYVDIPMKNGYSALNSALNCVKKNCPSYITNDPVEINGVYYYRFYFGNEKDQIWFMLRWL